MAQAQVSAPATPAKISTVYTGDVINGKKVVSSLNTDDLEPGKKHLLYFQGVQMSTGQYWYVSVIVAKGAKPGKRITLTSGVHGDEMSSVHTVQTVMGQLNAGGNVGHRHGGAGHCTPCDGEHAAPLAEFRARLRADRHEPRMARQRKRLRCRQPPGRAGVQPAAQAQHRPGHRLPYRDHRPGRIRLSHRRHAHPGREDHDDALPRSGDLGQPGLPWCAAQRLHRCGHSLLSRPRWVWRGGSIST